MLQNTTICVRINPEPIQYCPGRPRDREISKLIRSHLAENARRRKLQAPLLKSRRAPGGAFPDGPFCTCSASPAPSLLVEKEKGYKTSRAVQKKVAIADTYKICQRCRRVQFSELSWAGQMKTLKACFPTVAPFLEAEFDPFDSLPELSFLAKSTGAHRALNELKAHLVAFWPYAVLRSRVLPIAAKEPALFMGLLYSSAANLNAMSGGGETALSMAIKAEALRQIKIRLDDPEKQNTTLTVASIGYLSSGVSIYGSTNAAHEVQAHEDAMMLIFSEGMKWVLPDDDYVGQTLLHCLALHEFTRAATLGIPLRQEWVAAFCQSTHVITDVEYLPESPLYCPRADFYSICGSSKCSNETLRVLRGVRDIVNSILEDQSDFDYKRVRKELLSMPSATVASHKEVFGDSIYESCRLAASLMIEAIDTGKPFINLNPSTVCQLKSAMQKTDIGSYWGSMSGVLFWIAMVGSAAAFGKPEHSYMNSIVVRGDHELTYRNTVFEGATIAAYNFQRIHLHLIHYDAPSPGLPAGQHPSSLQ